MTNKGNYTTVEVEEVKSKPSFFAQNKKALGFGLGAIAIVALGYFGYTKLIAEPKEEAALEALASTQQAFNQGQYDKALAGDGQGNVGLQATLSQYSGTDAGNLAQLYAGIAYYNEGKYDEAIAAFEAFDDCGDNVISPAALAALGNCYACKKEYNKAVETLAKAADKADNTTLSPVYLIQAGEIYEFALNDKAKALELYTKVKDTYSGSYQVVSGEISKYIERASVK